MGKPAMTVIRPPRRLVDLFGGAGFAVNLIVSRADHASVDPDAYMPNLDEPFTKDELRKLDGLLASYEASDVGDESQERVVPPDK